MSRAGLRASSENRSSGPTPKPIGLKPDPVVREFVERYPDPLDIQMAAISHRPPPAAVSVTDAASPVLWP